MDNIRVSFPWVSILTLIFVVLKLTESGIVATWSWWWVVSPLWISLGVFVSVVFLIVLFAYILMLFGRGKKN